jgi:hypothetical protein
MLTPKGKGGKQANKRKKVGELKKMSDGIGTERLPAMFMCDKLMPGSF